MNPLAKWSLITGGALTLGGPALGVLGTVLGMMGGFDTLGKEGVADTEALASNIRVSLFSTAGGLIVGFIGVVLLLVGVIILVVAKPEKSLPLLNNKCESGPRD